MDLTTPERTHPAVGTDAAGRRQYLYHQKWQDERSEEKFDRVLQMSSGLPEWRSRIAEDLNGHGLTRDRVLALALHLLDRGYFRAGGEAYAEENNSYGIATLLCDHVTVSNGAVVFDYPAKSGGVQRNWTISDPDVVAVVRELRRCSPSGRLLVCQTDSGWVDIHSDDLNAKFKELLGEDYSVKDLRTWHGTVLAAAAFVDADPPVNKTVRKRVEAAVMKEVSEELGNTPRRGPQLLRRSAGAHRLRERDDDRRRREAGPQGEELRSRAGDPREGHRDDDPPGCQEPLLSYPECTVA